MIAVKKDRLLNKGCVYLAFHIVARLRTQLNRGDCPDTPMSEIHAPHKIGHPGHIVLGRNNGELGKAFQHATQDKHGDGAFDFVMQGGNGSARLSAKKSMPMPLRPVRMCKERGMLRSEAAAQKGS